MTKTAKDLATKILVVDPEGRWTLDEIKTHPFFKSINWSKLSTRDIEPYFIPVLKSETDTQYFRKKMTQKEVEKIKCSSSLSLTKYLSQNSPPECIIPTSKIWLDDF